jgi:hypothetical protein
MNKQVTHLPYGLWFVQMKFVLVGMRKTEEIGYVADHKWISLRRIENWASSDENRIFKALCSDIDISGIDRL